MACCIGSHELVVAVQRGEAGAVDALLQVCQTDARRYARRHCKIDDVDDAVQETLLIVSRKVHGLKVLAAFSSWMFVVIRRECQRLPRAMSNTEPIEDEVAETQLMCCDDVSLRIDLVAALESLPAHYLEVILLRDFEELTIGEMAERLHDTTAAIKSRLHRARELVREYLLCS